MATRYKVGDTVRLKSGGPRMTVTGIGDDPQRGQMIWTSYFVDGQTEKQGHFPAAAVEEYDEDDAS